MRGCSLATLLGFRLCHFPLLLDSGLDLFLDFLLLNLDLRLVWFSARFWDCGLPLDTCFRVSGWLLPAFVRFRFKTLVISFFFHCADPFAAPLRWKAFARPTSIRFTLIFIGIPLRTLGFRLATHYTFEISGFPFPAFDRFGWRCFRGSQFGFTACQAPYFQVFTLVVARIRYFGLQFVLDFTHHTVGL